MSLQSFYFPALGGAVLCYVGLLMLLPMGFRGRPNLSAAALVAVFGALIAAKAVIDSSTVEKGLIGTLLGLVGLVVLPAGFRGREPTLARAIRWVLIVHASIIAFQALAFALGFGYVDLLKPFGIAQTVLSKKGLIFGGVSVPRFAGLFNEPGSYSGVVMALLAAEYALSRRISRVTVFVLLSVAATVSLGGMALATGFLGAVVAGRVLRAQMRPQDAIGIGAALTAFVLYLRYNFAKRAQLFLETGMYQDAMVSWALSPKNLTLFGVQSSKLPMIYAGAYVGVWLDVLVLYGVVGIAALAAFLLGSLDLAGLLLAGVVLLSKLKFTYPLFFVLLGIIGLTHGRTLSSASAPEGRVSAST